MGIFAGLGSAIIGGLGSLFGRKQASDDQWNLQQDAQDFNSREAEKQRQFNAREAELARQWQEDFYTKYQSPSAMMAQYKDAGINPVMVAGQGAGSPPSASSASGSAASSGIGSAPGPANLIDSIMGMMRLKAEIDNINADTENKQSQSSLFNSQVAINNLTGNEIQQRTKLLLAQTENELEKKGLIALQKVTENLKSETMRYDILKQQWEKEYHDIYGSYPSSGLWDLVRNGIELSRLGIKSGFNYLRGIINDASSQGVSFMPKYGR